MSKVTDQVDMLEQFRVRMEHLNQAYAIADDIANNDLSKLASILNLVSICAKDLTDECFWIAVATNDLLNGRLEIDKDRRFTGDRIQEFNTGSLPNSFAYLTKLIVIK